MKILLVDDDPSFRRLTSLALAEASIEHEAVATAQEAMQVLARAKPSAFDLILLDQELPGMKGSELLTHLRQKGVLVPVVLCSVREGVDEKVRALDLGADDYVVKPFQFDELAARLRAVLRRNRTSDTLRVGNLELDPILRRAIKAGAPLDLSAREFDVLWLLCQARERAISRGEFLHRIWNMDFDPETNSLQVHVSRLRRKLGANGGVRIETVRGQGYRIVSLVDAPRDAVPPNGLAPIIARQQESRAAAFLLSGAGPEKRRWAIRSGAKRIAQSERDPAPGAASQPNSSCGPSPSVLSRASSTPRRGIMLC